MKPCWGIVAAACALALTLPASAAAAQTEVQQPVVSAGLYAGNDNGYLVGMVSMADVAIETRQDRELADAIEDISKGTSFWNRIFG